MDILLIGKGGKSHPNLEKALQKMGHRVQRPADGTGTEGWDTVILDPWADPADPELAWAQVQGLTIQSLAEFLYGHAKEKTRVVIAGGPGRDEILSMILHVLEYHGIEVDHYLGDGAKAGVPEVSLGRANDFIVIQGDDRPASALDPRPQFHLYRPNIALVCGMPHQEGPDGTSGPYRNFVDSIVKGGSITFDQEDDTLAELVNSSGNPIRKFPYATPGHRIAGGTAFLDTPEGELPLQGFGKKELRFLEGAKWICQQLGVDPVGFYEAMTTYSP